MATYNRLLTVRSDVESFVYNVLDIFENAAFMSAVGKIMTVEMQLNYFNAHQTLNDDTYRVDEYKSSRQREALRKRIHDELIGQVRPDKDDEIRLGYGGALPRSGHVDCDKKLFYTIGLPASGKSGISNTLSDAENAVIIDSDMAKRKLPEYYDVDGGASLVNKESSAIVMEYERQNLFASCVEKGYNLIVPKIGNYIKEVIGFFEYMKREKGYSIFLVLIELDRLKATRRAFKRFLETGRYVPLSLIFDSYANDPTLTYFKIIKYNGGLLDGYAHIDNDVEFGHPYIVKENKGICAL